MNRPIGDWNRLGKVFPAQAGMNRRAGFADVNSGVFPAQAGMNRLGAGR